MSIFIISDSSVEHYNGKYYAFRGAKGRVKWPMEDGVNLGAVGIWNVLWRLGYHPKFINSNNLPTPTNKDILFCSAADILGESLKTFLKKWVFHNGKLCVSGCREKWIDFLPFNSTVTSVRYDNPYGALAYKIGSENTELIAPPQWTYLQIESSSIEKIGSLVAIHGERQSPSRALVTFLQNAPAIFNYGKFYVLNGNPFAAFQAWLQGQEDLQPWMQWRNRLFWLDEFAAYLGKIFSDIDIIPHNAERPGIVGIKNTTIILRHDLDSSRDLSYIDLEDSHSIPGVHAVLLDSNKNFWINRLSLSQTHETAFHYSTVKSCIRGIGRISKFFDKDIYTKAYPKSIAGKSLYQQVQKAKKTGIKASTIHRHYSYLYYPEWIDALDYVFFKDLSILGSSSLFRGQVLRWGTHCVDAGNSYAAYFPDSQFPLWYPFKLCDAATGKMLRGWESTSIMEMEPEFARQLLNYSNAALNQFIFTFNYHPAHAQEQTFTDSGSIEWFVLILNYIKSQGLNVSTLKHIYTLCKKYA